jgi:glyoxylase-like metal-dependent hydrolase (beta-lactamase superfamily II)/rhodanese-related sulfurtransferase
VSSTRGYSLATLETPSLGDRSYVVWSGGIAAIIDPQRDVDRVWAQLEEHELDVAVVVETHIHNDYVSGGLELARRTSADYCVSATDTVAYDRRPVAHGDRVEFGDLALRVIHTPGHTPTHLSYVLERDQADLAVFSGGSLLFGTVGRTDLIGPELTEQLTRSQYRSARRLITELPDTAAVYPTHGFGSFCAAVVTEVDEAPATPAVVAGTIGTERMTNLAMTAGHEDAFVSDLIAGLGDFPRYYAHMGPANRAGPTPIDLTTPRRADPEELRARVVAGEWVVDLRSRRAFAAGHLDGTIGIEMGDSFITYLGWLLPWGTPVTLLGDDDRQVAEAQRAMARIGIDHPAAQATGGHGVYGERDDVSAYRVARFTELAAEGDRGDVAVVDVRRDEEWDEGHVEGAIHLPIHRLSEHMAKLPDHELWVHCRTGYRASVACSLLDRAGRRVVLVDDLFERAAAAGIEMVGNGRPETPDG